jgi:hypothetical protein
VGSLPRLSPLLAVVLIADGLITVAWGRGFLSWQRRIVPGWYKPALDALLDWPESRLRAGTAGETALGTLWLAYLLCEEKSNE